MGDHQLFEVPADSWAKETTMAKKNTTKNTQAQKKQLSAEQIALREQKAQEKRQKAEQARIEFDGANVYLVSSKKNKKGEPVECKDVLSGLYTDKAVSINTDRYNWTIITAQADGTCYVDSYTKGKNTSASYARNNSYAKKIRGESKQNAIKATRGLPFSKFIAVCKNSKKFKPCENAQALAWIDNALKAQEARTAKATQAQEAPKAEPEKAPKKASKKN